MFRDKAFSLMSEKGDRLRWMRGALPVAGKATTKKTPLGKGRWVGKQLGGVVGLRISPSVLLIKYRNFCCG